MTIESLDHLVLTVKDMDRTCNFYSRILGMEIVTFGEGRKALRFGQQKINLHQIGHEFEPKAQAPTLGSADLCFLTTTPITEVLQTWTTLGVKIVEGPVTRTGATGVLFSLYTRDPDGNLIEVSTPTIPTE